MIISDEQRIKQIWARESKLIPVLLRRGPGNPLLARLPYADGNRQWLRGQKRRKPKWDYNDKTWELPQAWFNDLVEQSLHRFGQTYIIQPYREQEKCAPACMNAKGHECQCSCMGANSSWFVVSDTFATRWNKEYMACRLLSKRG